MGNLLDVGNLVGLRVGLDVGTAKSVGIFVGPSVGDWEPKAWI